MKSAVHHSRVRLGFPTWFVAALLLISGGFLYSQQQQSQQPQQQDSAQQKPTFTSNVRVVEVPATVRDKHKQIVRNLTKDDFVLEEDGRPQTIRYFNEDTNIPLTLGLLVDTSQSQRRVLEDERHASFSFLNQMLHDKNMAFVIHFDKQVELLQDLTSDRAKLDSALDALQIAQNDNRDSTSGGQGGGGGGGGGQGGGWPGGGGGWPGGGGRRRSPGGGGQGGGGGYRRGGTQLYDAIFLASDELLKKQQGRKAVIVLSDGVDHGSKVSLDHAIEAAQRADTVVYSILFKDEEHESGFGGFGRRGGRYPQEERPDGKKILERISKETGGRLFEISKKDPVDQIYNQIADELRYQYELAYTPDRNDLTGYHKIHLAAKQKELEVQARDGYYADR